jgi:hypothetical protein
MAALGAYRPIPFPITSVRNVTRKRSLRQVVSSARSFYLDQGQPQDMSRYWWPDLGADEVVGLIVRFMDPKRIGRPPIGLRNKGGIVSFAGSVCLNTVRRKGAPL